MRCFMPEKLFSNFEYFPDFLRSRDLVKLGLWPSTDAVYLARLRGISPNFIKVGRKILYPKSSVIEFIQDHLNCGKSSKNKDV